jgi:hypothetical protein
MLRVPSTGRASGANHQRIRHMTEREADVEMGDGYSPVRAGRLVLDPATRAHCAAILRRTLANEEEQLAVLGGRERAVQLMDEPHRHPTLDPPVSALQRHPPAPLALRDRAVVPVDRPLEQRFQIALVAEAFEQQAERRRQARDGTEAGLLRTSSAGSDVRQLGMVGPGMNLGSQASTPKAVANPLINHPAVPVSANLAVSSIAGIAGLGENPGPSTSLTAHNTHRSSSAGRAGQSGTGSAVASNRKRRSSEGAHGSLPTAIAGVAALDAAVAEARNKNFTKVCGVILYPRF